MAESAEWNVRAPDRSTFVGFWIACQFLPLMLRSSVFQHGRDAVKSQFRGEHGIYNGAVVQLLLSNLSSERFKSAFMSCAYYNLF
jgi:hypothetical protein